jgi:chromosome segregation ATPase
MAANTPSSPAAAVADNDAGLPEVCLEVGSSTSRPTLYVVTDAGFLIGTVPGCDLRVPGHEWPAVLCLLARHPGGASIRKLSPTQPLLVNGKAVTSAILNNGDRVHVGPVEIAVQVFAAKSSAKSTPRTGVTEPALESARAQIQQQVQQVRDQVVNLEKDRQRFKDECTKKSQELAEREAALEKRRLELERQPPPPTLDERLTQREGELAKQREQLTAQRQELADIRTQLYDRYRERRDRLAGLQESVNKAARKVQERKQALEAEVREWENRRKDEAARQAELEAQAADVRQARQLFDEERKLHEGRVADLHQEVADRVTAVQEQEDRLTADCRALEDNQARHKEDLLRLDRLRGELDEREKQIDGRNQEVEQRLEQLRSDTREMEAQVVQLDEWHTKLSAVAEKLARQKAEQEQVSQQLAQRTATLEGQQAALAALRTRLERMREETRQQEQQLAEQRHHQDTAETELRRQREEMQKLREELDGDRTLVDQERRMLTDRSAVLDSAAAQLRQTQERVAVDEQRIREQTQALDAMTAQQTEAGSLLEGRIKQYEDLHKRLEAERDNLRERSLLLAQAEQAREALQEQLRRRSEELGTRQKALSDQVTRHEADVTALQSQRDTLAAEQQKSQEDLGAERQKLEQRATGLDKLQAELASRAEALAQQQQQLAESLRTFDEQGLALAEQRARFDADRQAAEAAAQQTRADLEAARREAQLLKQQLPELELRAGTALERLTHAREQIREHLDEVHAYAGQCRDELSALRDQVQAEAERLHLQEQGLRRGHDEQRLAVAGFRQQLIDWQGQIDDMKRLMAHDEARVEQRQAQVAEQARQLGAETVRLAQQAEVLHEQAREVAEKRSEMDRHLGDMREWYRRKLRELAGIRDADDAPEPVDEAADTTDRRDILSLTGDVDPIDQKLGDLMLSLELVEPDTLTALFVEARRQRRSLRQVLLASGTVTLYQMALIEAGNLDGLVLGPVRVVDRLRATPQETVYRVFDPRRGCDAVLRHLTEAEMQQPGHADEFRRSFSQAVLSQPNLASVLEVLAIGGRPAVLQEWLTGLAGNDWPPLAAVAGVWYRLLLQAAQALHAAHEAGIVHGHLQPTHFWLTADGVLKLSGFGEPPWLVSASLPSWQEASGDLRALGSISTAWSLAGRKNARGKALPDALQALVDRVGQAGGITSAAALIEELEKVADSVPGNPEAWDRLLKHVRDHATPLANIRQSA